MILSAALVAGASVAGPAAHAALVISTGANSNAGCYEGEFGMICAATAATANLNVTTLENLLASYNVNVETASATDDIIVNAPLSWVSASGLAVIAQRSIKVNAHVSDAGSGELSLTTGTGGRLSFGGGGNIGFLSTSNLLLINNQSYQLVNSIASLKTWVGNNPANDFALVSNYDATPDGTYAQAPIQSTLTGRLEGLGNTISNLHIVDATAGDYVGLFAQVQGGTIENLRLTNVTVQATGNSSSSSNAGGLVGYNAGTLFGDSVTGHVTGSYASVGGLAGGQGYGATSNSFSTATVKGTKAGAAGGLMGFQVNSASVDNSYATGTVTGGSGMNVGGLIGSNTEPVRDSYATGAVTGGGTAQVGGLIGIDWGGTVTRSWASGSATVGALCCGLNTDVGGLVGELSSGAINQSYATGAVKGGSGASAGGLSGDNFGAISNSYATGRVHSAGGSVGGFVGYNDGMISASYSTGAVSGGATGSMGGLLGVDSAAGGSLKHTYWDTTTSGITSSSQGAGSPSNDPGIKANTTAQLKSGLPGGFGATVWGEATGLNGGLPYLLAIPPK